MDRVKGKLFKKFLSILTNFNKKDKWNDDLTPSPPKKMLSYLGKFWVNGHCLSEKCRNFGVFMSLWPCQEWKTFLNITKVNIYAYSHINIKNILTFQRIFDILKLKKSYKIKKIWRFWIKQGPFTQNFAKRPYIFLFQIS